ncbi:CpsD/CapB family tyrosine-protein kinase [Erythrobacter sp. SD-21]|uniref:CpsD/CapB family tyrosine-protein kinase n=1 Tax=Erythrobacter sp. SD-21 TaxID=161528 RepID=UPI000153F3A4|nr:CpsD/CapB family tyrosine-protein kinase [Erythrobacter sp. SD-21]EDL49325.1 Protein-tyrosine kinase [Erythrobacter sp. SD-21]
MSETIQADSVPTQLEEIGTADGLDQAAENSFEFSSDLVLLSERGSLAAENISLLVSELLSRHVQSARRGLAFCSSSADTGCSYLAANVAVGMAMAGVRTLLIDANFRDPKIDQYIIPNSDSKGLLHCIENSDVGLDEAISEDVLPNLSVLHAGGVAAEAGLLASANARAVFSEALRSYDCTIVDTAPSNQSSDAIRVTNMVRYALVIARKDHTYLNDMKKLIADIRQNRGEVLGTYLNEF